MADVGLNIFDRMAAVALEPISDERLGREPKLDDEPAGEVFRLYLAAFFLPKGAGERLRPAPIRILASEPPMN
jgi:hypothetical protein